MMLTSPLALLVVTTSFLSGRVDVKEINGCDEFYDIAIVGGGSAGAYSAYKLRNQDKKIGLFEYSSRVGGRALNYQLPSAPDVLLQMGVMRFVEGVHVKFDKLSQKLGLKKIEFTEGEGRSDSVRFFLRGHSLSYEDVFFGRIPYNLTEEESKNRYRMVDFYFERLTNFKVEDIENDYLTASDIFSFKVVDGSGRYLYQLTMDEALSLAASPDGKAFFEDTSQFNSFFESDTSAVSVFLYPFFKKGGEVLTLENGMEAFPRALVEQFLQANTTRHVLKLNSKLTSIQKAQANMYTLSFKPTVWNNELQKTVEFTFKKKIDVCAGQVILALPMFALKQIDWKPLQSGITAETISSYTFPTTSKIFMTFKTPWWLKTYPNHYVNVGDKKTSYGQMCGWRRSKVTGDYVLMVSYTDGLRSQYLKHLQTQGTRVKGSERGAYQVTTILRDALLDGLSDALHVPRDQIPEPTAAVAQFWADYPFGSLWVTQKAGYSYDDAGRVLRKPSITDNVFLVGADYAWGDERRSVEGALNTVDSVIQEYFKTFESNH